MTIVLIQILTLDILFERDQKKANVLIKKALTQIGETWQQRLKNKFSNYDYTLVMYFNSEDLEWYLDFYNGTVDIEKNDSSGRCKKRRLFKQVEEVLTFVGVA